MTDHDASTPFDDVLLARLRSTDPGARCGRPPQ